MESLKQVEQEPKKESNEAELSKKEIENNSAAFNELYELTQRKFLSQLIRITNSMQINKKYPRLFCIDLLSAKKIQNVNNFQKPTGNLK